MVKQIENKDLIKLIKKTNSVIRGKLWGRIVQKMIKIKKEVATCLKLKKRNGQRLNMPLNLCCFVKFDGNFLIAKKGGDLKPLDSNEFSTFALRANRINGRTTRKITHDVNDFIKHYPKINISKKILEHVVFLTQFRLMNYIPERVFNILRRKNIVFYCLFHKESVFSWIFFETHCEIKLIVIHLLVTNVLTTCRGFEKEIMRVLSETHKGYKFIVGFDIDDDMVEFYKSIGFRKEEKYTKIPPIYKCKVVEDQLTVIMFCESLKINHEYEDYSLNYFSSSILFHCCAATRRFFEVLFFLLNLVTDYNVKCKIFCQITKIVELIYNVSCLQYKFNLDSRDFMYDFIGLLGPIVTETKKLAKTDLKNAENFYKADVELIKDTRYSSDWFRFFLNN